MTSQLPGILALTVETTPNTIRLHILTDEWATSERVLLRSQTRPGMFWQMGGDWDNRTERALVALGVLALDHGGPDTYGHTDIIAGPVLSSALRSMGQLPR